VKTLIKRMPVLGPLARTLKRYLATLQFSGSEQYWIRRYATGGDSGPGSRDKLAEFKAEVLNGFVKRNSVASIIEYGCGDGEQLKRAVYPDYLGFDISPQAISRCESMFRSDPCKRFALMKDYQGERADLALSLEVIFHLVEDEVFESYMARLFGSADRFVVIYSSDTNEQLQPAAPHIRHREFTKWVRENVPEWRLVDRIANKYPLAANGYEGSFSTFWVYEKT
jgi:hypothetical protein